MELTLQVLITDSRSHWPLHQVSTLMAMSLPGWQVMGSPGVGRMSVSHSHSPQTTWSPPGQHKAVTLSAPIQSVGTFTQFLWEPRG